MLYSDAKLLDAALKVRAQATPVIRAKGVLDNEDVQNILRGIGSNIRSRRSLDRIQELLCEI